MTLDRLTRRFWQLNHLKASSHLPPASYHQKTSILSAFGLAISGFAWSVVGVATQDRMADPVPALDADRRAVRASRPALASSGVLERDQPDSRVLQVWQPGRARKRSISPEVFESTSGKLCVAHRVLNVFVSQIELDGSGIVALVRKVEASAVP